MAKVPNKWLKNTCRVCGKYASFKKSFKIFDKANKKLLGNIETLTGLRLESYLCLPELMCECCNIELTSAVRFRDRCISAQRELLAGLTKQQQEGIPEKYKALVMGNEALTPSADDQETEGDSEPETEMEREIEPDYQHADDDDLVKLLPESSGTVTKVKYEIGPDMTDFIEADEDDNESLVEETQYECLMADDDGNIVKIENMSNQLIVPDPTEVYLYDSDDEVAVLDNVLDDEYEHENAVKKSSLPPKPKIKPEDPRRRGAGGVYICEQCGNHIKGRMAFELHCRRHRGEKDFQCEICDKCFCTTSELKRHMRKHTGERPFACQYCGRCFSDYTTRVKHERTHTNERPYVCGTCGKAFTTGYILKNHMLTHSGLRSYRCELCDKSFMLPTHLSTHMRTGVHKRTLEKYQMKQQMQHDPALQLKLEMDEESLHIQD
ncbi:transcription factor Ouib [Drosophila novamexicana]|uniref:transcription factor Ouib n=1 Tax=Drosophila novamexicana TaxID=47314 RepID=UPI0011E5B1C0|nr:transcription factor Ouib [Drosophila novamexicana]